MTVAAVAQLTKVNVGYVGITSDNAAAFVARASAALAGIATPTGREVVDAALARYA